MRESDYVGLWNACLEIIKDNVPEQAYKTWFLPIKPLKYEDDTLVVQVPSQFFYEFLEEKFVDLLRKTLYKVIGEGTKLMYNVMVDKTSQATVNLVSTSRTIIPQRKVQNTNIPQTPIVAELDPHLNTEYNFDTFIEGNSNKLARSVAVSIADNPAKTIFNPVFFHGTSGVGKTHLVNAIGIKIKEKHPDVRVLYVSAHLFQVQYTDSVRNNTTNDFINFYQSVDVLIIDDIQEFAGVTKTQNTFFHIFNHLRQNGKQLILTSDRAPILLQGMEERLITRFKWGMVAELEKPTVELRRNILRSKIHRDGLQFSDEIIDYIAENVNDSIRDLEGVVISMMAHATIYNEGISLSLAKRIVKKISNSEKKNITIDEIIAVVCHHFSLDVSTIQTKSRKREVVQARQLAMYLSKLYTDCTNAKIGTLIGGKDHATVMHACKMVKELQEVDKGFRAELEELQQQLAKKQG